ncbi:MAG: amidohydrolase family protein [Terriglobia bacterium]
MSASAFEPALAEAAAWNVFDANARVGHSGVHGALALEAPDFIAEMDRFGIKQALVSHFAAEEYDAEKGNRELSQDVQRYPDRVVPAWAALPDSASITTLAKRNPAAVRLFPGLYQHNFSLARWCSGELYEYLQTHTILVLIERQTIEWNSLDSLLRNFPHLKVLLLETGYRADRYLFPLLHSFRNLYFDTSTYVAHRQLETFVETFGADRMVFGSRMPFYTPGASLAVLATARISDEARLSIAGGTLRRLLERKAQ